MKDSSAEANRPDPTVILGERIVAELGDPRTGDTLSRWLAHHVAGLLGAAEQAELQRAPDAGDRAAQARAAILDLWEHRSAWPRGWPPPRAAALVRLLDDLPDIDDAGWGVHNLLGELQLLHHRLLAALTDLAVTGDVNGVEEGWLNTFGQQLSPDEIAMLTRVASAPRRLTTLFAAKPLSAAYGSAGSDSNEANAEGENVSRPDRKGERALASAALAIVEAYREVVNGFVERLIIAGDRTDSASGETADLRDTETP